MNRSLSITLILALLTQAGCLFSSPANAQQRRYIATSTQPTRALRPAYLRTGLGQLSPQMSAASAPGADWRNGLAPTRLDSFVREARGHAEHIYGDEGADGLPPYFGFDHVHRINTGINDERDAGLTTAHGSYMPEAWGADEFIAPPGEFSQSGSNYGNHNYNNAAAGLDAANQQAGQHAAGQVTEAELAAHPSPGEGYQPMFQHGIFVGWWSPAEIELAQTDFPAALRSIIVSDRFWGDAYSIRVEIGDI